MDLRQVLNVAYVFVTEGMDDDARAAWDRRHAGTAGRSPRRDRDSQRDLMSAMNLGRR
jgi:hypothetical protein